MPTNISWFFGGVAGVSPAEGVAEDTTKRSKWRKWLVAKKCILVLAQTLKLVQGDGRSLRGLATYGIFGATRGWSEGETSPT